MNSVRMGNIEEVNLIGENLISESGRDFNRASKVMREIKTPQTGQNANEYLIYLIKRTCEKDYFSGYRIINNQLDEDGKGKTMKVEFYRLR